MNIIILSRNPALYSTQSLYRAARQKGHKVRVIDHVQCDIVIEQGKLAVYYGREKIKNVHAIIPRIGSSVTKIGAMILKQFEIMNIPSLITSESLLQARDKITSLQLLASKGIGIPKTLVLNNTLNMPFMMDKVPSYPAIVKITDSTHGLGVILSHDKKNAESMIEAFGRVNQKSMLQEYIQESNGEDIRVFVVDGEVVASMKRKAFGNEFRSNLHRGGIASIAKLSFEEKEVAIKAAKLHGLSVAGIDILRSNRGPLVLEVNASPGLEGIETTTKVDIAAKIIECLERKAKKKWRVTEL